MIRGIALLLVLVVAGAFAGTKIAGWYLDAQATEPELESAIVPVVGGVAGAIVALGVGIAVAYVVGRNEAGKDR